MRIWIVNQYAVPLSEPGITRHVEIGRRLVAAGHEVTVIAGDRHYAERDRSRLREGESARIDDVEGVRFVSLRTPAYKRNFWKRGLNLLAFVARLGRLDREGLDLPRPEVVVGSSPSLTAAFGAWWLAHRLRVPFVLEVRDLWPMSLIDLGGLSPRHPAVLVLGALERFLYRRAAAIITVPGAAEPHFRARGATTGVVRHVPNGASFAGDAPPPPPRAADGRFVVMYAGAIGLANNLDVVLAAAAELGPATPVAFEIVGAGPEKERLQAEAAAAGLRNVAFRDPVPKREVGALLAGADAFLMPLRPSPLFRLGVSPNKLYDYLDAARPILFGIDAPEDPVSEAGAGLRYEPGDGRSLAEAIGRLAALPADERAAMGQRGRAYVRARCSLDRIAADWGAAVEAGARGPRA